MPHGVSRCPAHAVQREHSRANYDVRRWYRTARWSRLRADVLNENPLCVDCTQEQRVQVATEVDHKVPHRGDPVMFWDRANLQGMCASHHSAKTARGE